MLIIEVRVAVNLMSLTIEQAVSKRRKVVMDMAANMRAELSQEVLNKSWGELRALVPDAGARARRALDVQLKGVTSREPEYYNDDDKLGGAIKGAVDAKAYVSRWPQLLLDSVSPMQRATIGDKVLLERYLQRSDKLVRTCDTERGGTPLVEVPHGINPVLANLALASRLCELSLSGNRLTDSHLGSLCGAMELNDSTRLTLMVLDGNLLTTLDPLLALLPGCLRDLRRLDLARNKLKAGAIKALADALPAARSLRRVDVLMQTNHLSADAAAYLMAKAEECVAVDAALPWPERTGSALRLAARDGTLAGDPLATLVTVPNRPEHDDDDDGDEGRQGGGQPAVRITSYAGVPVYDEPHFNGAISLCGRRLVRPELLLAERKLPALTDADVCVLAMSLRVLGAAHTLVKIDISGNKVSSTGVVALMEALTAAPIRRLRSLSVANNAINRTAVEAVAAALHALDLTELSMGYSYAGATAEGMGALGSALEHAPNLEVLALQRCQLSSESLKSLVGSMRGRVPRLRHLLLDSNIMAARGHGDILRACPALLQLRVQNCGITNVEDIVAALGEADVAPSIQEISLGANEIAASSLKLLHEAAAKRPALKLSNATEANSNNSALVADRRRQERIGDLTDPKSE